MVARAHQLVMGGYKHLFDGKLVTVWSAPNYGYKQNLACVLELDEDMQEVFKLFNHAPLDVAERGGVQWVDCDRYRYAV